MCAERSPISQADRVVLALRRMLLQGEFSAAERLTELGLAARLHASRTPVRQALNRLAHEGLLEELPRRGFRIRAFTVGEVWDAIEPRGVLEGTAARLAAEKLSSSDELHGLREALAAMERVTPETVQEFAVYLRLNDEFHREIWRLARSPILLRALEGVAALPFAAPGALVFGHGESAVARRTAAIAQDQHRGMVDAIARHAGTRAEALAREHALIARRNLERALEDPALRCQIPGAALVTLPFAV
jgi:GntR family transcriptional regulator of vanillate catabolism